MTRMLIAIIFALFVTGHTATAQLHVDPNFTWTVDPNVSYGSSLTGTGVNLPRYLDVYEPTGASLPPELPAIVLMHGGSFVEGDKGSGTMRRYAEEFASRGYVAVSINYRLMFDDFFPDPPGDPITPVASRFPAWLLPQLTAWGADIEDYAAEMAAAAADHAMAVNWLVANAGTYSIDPQRIAVGGYSAGAISSQMLGAGAVDGVSADVGAVFSQAGGLFGLETFIDATDPGFFILHGDLDETVPFAEVGFSQTALTGAGVPFESRIVAGADHENSGVLMNAIFADPDPFFQFMIDQLDAHAAVPEPSTFALACLGTLGLLVRGRRRR